MKTIIKGIISFFGIFLIINAIWAFFETNSNLGNYVCMLAGIVFLFSGTFENKLPAHLKNKAMTYLKYTLFIICFLMIIFSFFLESYGRHPTVTYSEDALIVLGAGVRGESVSRPLAERLDKAVLYLEKNKDALVIVSGGKGNDENVSEAEAMKKYLMNKGVDRKRIIKEEKSTSTYENFKYSKEILDEVFENGYSTAFITNNFHVFRAERISEEAGLDCSHDGAPVSWYTFWPCTLREGLAVAKNIVIGK